MDGSYAVVTEGLRKTYRGRPAVAGLDLAVPSRGVHGFLGPNGSGKTTTIRMLLGLVRPTAGSVRLFGEPVPARLPAVISRVGAIVESPKFFPNFSARTSLRLLASAIGVPAAAVDDVLERTSLRDRADDPFHTFSLGMKQRLAIAATLLKSPDLLIFDEPTNGLDPAGIREIRGTMRQLAEEGRAVLVSSHILSEVEHVADTVTIIGNGATLASGTVAEVIGARSSGVRVDIADMELARTTLAEAGYTVHPVGEHLLVEGEDDPARITYLLARAGQYVRGLRREGAGLESVFLELTSAHELGGSHPDPGTAETTERRS